MTQRGETKQVVAAATGAPYRLLSRAHETALIAYPATRFGTPDRLRADDRSRIANRDASPGSRSTVAALLIVPQRNVTQTLSSPWLTEVASRMPIGIRAALLDRSP